MELIDVAKKLTDATCPEDVFGGPANGSSIAPVYRQLIMVVHPDHFNGNSSHLALANQAFTKLTSLRGDAERKVKAGTYGQKNVAPPPMRERFQPIALEINGRKFILTDHIASGDLSDVYLCTISVGSLEHKVAFKIVKNGSDNDLMENEARTLRKLYPDGAKEEKFYRFLPKLMDTFIVRAPGSQRRVNVLPWFPEHRPLSEVMQVFPDGIDFKDMVWMFKRILHGVGFAHVNKIVHGAIIPPHVMIHPVDHGAKIVDWAYAVDITSDDQVAKPKGGTLYDMVADNFLTNPHVKAISGGYRDYYPPEVFEKETPTPATDIFMAAKCAVALVGGDVKRNQMPKEIPSEIQGFFLRCLHDAPSKRPQDAWDAHEELDAILKRVVGKRTYRPFPMPER